MSLVPACSLSFPLRWLTDSCSLRFPLSAVDAVGGGGGGGRDGEAAEGAEGKPKEGVLLSGLDPKRRAEEDELVEWKEKSSLFCLSLGLLDVEEEEAFELSESVRWNERVDLGGMLS